MEGLELIPNCVVVYARRLSSVSPPRHSCWPYRPRRPLRRLVLNQTFRWQAEPVGNDTSTASGSLNLLYGSGGNPPAETGLRISSKGLFTFASGQTFPGTGSGTVKSVGLSASISDFTVTGSPVTSSGTLGLNWNIAPTNGNTPNAIVKRDASGNFTAGTANLSGIAINATSTLPVSVSTTAANGIAIEGSVSSTGSAGVMGQTSSLANSSGVFGEAPNSNFATTYGVYGLSASPVGAGVFGQSLSISGLGQDVSSLSIGVWGDGGGQNVTAVGLLSTVDDGVAGIPAVENRSGESQRLRVRTLGGRQSARKSY